MTENQKRLYNLIDEILWNDWDPIGVNKIPEVRNEYYSYLPAIFELKTSGTSGQAIAAYLYQIETVNMGLVGNLENCSKVANKILAVVS